MTVSRLIAALRKAGLAAKKPGVPRVSTILKPLKPNFSPAMARAGEIAMERGTRTHLAIESVIEEGAPWALPRDLEDDITGNLVSWAHWFRRFAPNHPDYKFFTEVPMAGKIEVKPGKKRLLRGTADFIGVRRYKVDRSDQVRWDFLIYDWKSGKRIYDNLHPQIAAYSLMLAAFLRDHGIEDYTIDSRLILVSPLGLEPTTASCHQSDDPVVRRLLAKWHKSYRADPDMARRHDYGVKREIEEANNAG